MADRAASPAFVPASGAELVPVQTRLERTLADELEALAKRNDRSVAAEVRLAIKDRISEQTEN